MENRIIGLDERRITNFVERTEGCYHIFEYDCGAKAVFGLGERYCSVNHIGRTLKSQVVEKFCEQGEFAYLPLPFYHTDEGHGVFVNTAYEVVFDFTEGHFRMELPVDASYELYFFYGTPKEIIAQFIELTGEIKLPPKWAFGVWASANRWNCQRDIEEQMSYAEKYNYPINVVVIEAWSDEATFYLWNGSKYEAVDGKEALTRKNITFGEPWPSPDKMIEKLHERGMKLVLWQIPALKKLDPGQESEQHDRDCAYAVEQGMVALNADGTPYRIPKQWFIGSMLPDFSDPRVEEWWFSKRKYLLDMGVDGFKTDGGEFIHDEKIRFYQDLRGTAEKNLYPAQYERAYDKFIGNDRVLFSRAGYLGAQTTPMHWAGDQMSKFSELQSVLRGGLSLSLCGVPFWSFDIGGFAGPMPSKELYLRATALGAFVPAMQWHSEPADGQFSEIMKGTVAVNDRSPWNLSAYYGGDEEILKTAQFFANLHMNFLPYFYSEAIKCAKNREPFLKHLFLEYPEDEIVRDIEDAYMIGDLLVAPVVEEGASGRRVYLPKGIWYNFWDGSKIVGGTERYEEVCFGKILLYVREGAVLALNLGESGKLGGVIGNDVDKRMKLSVIPFGSRATGEIWDEAGIRIVVTEGNIVKAGNQDSILGQQEYCQKIF